VIDVTRPGTPVQSGNHNYLKLVASGDVDETMLEALEDYVKRQKKRLARPAINSPKARDDMRAYMQGNDDDEAAN
jgi:hypothetical protein